MYRTVMVPVDGTTSSLRAARHAIGLTEAVGGDLEVLSVVESKPVYTRYGYGGLAGQQAYRDHERAAQLVVEDVASLAAERGVPSDTTVKRGVPHVVIPSHAGVVEADAIVMVAAGRRSVMDLVFGSVTERVIRNAAATVIVVE